MQLIRCCSEKVFRVMKNKVFWVCMLTVVSLMLTAGIYYKDETEYSVFSVIIHFSRTYQLQNPVLSSCAALLVAFGRWYGLLLPVVAAFPYIHMQLAERRSGFEKLYLSRMAIGFYILQDIIVCIFSVFALLLFSYLIYGIIVVCCLPSLGGYDKELQKFYSYGWSEVAKYFLCNILYAIQWSLPALFLSSVISNLYLIAGIPFLLKYVYTQFFNDPDRYNLFYAPDSILYLGYGYENKIRIILFWLLFVCVLLSAYILLEKRRLHYGQ